jgi:hypothetical protein
MTWSVSCFIGGKIRGGEGLPCPTILREQGMSNGVFFAGSITILMRLRQGLGKIVQKNSIRTVLGSSVPWYWERRNVPEKRRNEFHAKDATIAKRGSALLFLYWEGSYRNFKKTPFLPNEFSRAD